MNNEPHLLGIQLVIFYAEIFEEKNFFLEVPNFPSVKKICKLSFQSKITVLMNAFFFTQMFLREKQESFFHHVENMQSKQNTLLVNLYLSNVYINVKRPPKKYITFYEEVVINLG